MTEDRQDLIFLAHRPPFPPDKGEKIRAWHILQHLAARFRVHLGCVVDDPEDLAHASALEAVCASVKLVPITRSRQALRALLYSRPGRPLMPDMYTSPELRLWARRTQSRTGAALTYVYTAAMAPHALRLPGPKLLDAVDIDSEKWAEYAAHARFPMRFVWAREGRTLLRYERYAAARCDETLFVSESEAKRFAVLAPELSGRIGWVENGVDLDRFSPGHRLPSPFPSGGTDLVLTGHMDYWPNADAAAWFAAEIHPLVRRRVPDARFWIVGANPTDELRTLALLPGVHVTGRVEDVRPYLAHAAVVVCPLRLARGIQNKVLEGMAMGRPVIASEAAFEGIRAEPGRDLLVPERGAEAFAAAVIKVVAGEHAGLESAARDRMEAAYAWPTVLGRLDDSISRVLAEHSSAQPVAR